MKPFLQILADELATDNSELQSTEFVNFSSMRVVTNPDKESKLLKTMRVMAQKYSSLYPQAIKDIMQNLKMLGTSDTLKSLNQ